MAKLLLWFCEGEMNHQELHLQRWKKDDNVLKKKTNRKINNKKNLFCEGEMNHRELHLQRWKKDDNFQKTKKSKQKSKQKNCEGEMNHR